MSTLEKEKFCQVWLAFDKRAERWREELATATVPGTVVAEEIDEVLRGLSKAVGFTFHEEPEEQNQ